MAEEKEEKKDFVVKDRRIFAEENLDAAETEEKDAPASKEAQEPDSSEEPEATAEQQPEPPPQFPEINFATFVASLNASALLQLGAIEDPTSGQKNKDLPMAPTARLAATPPTEPSMVFPGLMAGLNLCFPQ